MDYLDDQFNLTNETEVEPIGQGSNPLSTKLASVIISIIICVFGLFGNLVAIFVIFILKEYKKSVTHWYILQLALTNLIFLLTLPFNISEILKGEWVFAEWMCKGKETILFLNLYASMLFLSVMSFDRFIAVCYIMSDKAQALRKASTSAIITIFIWAVSILLCIPVMLFSFKSGFHPKCKCLYAFPKYNFFTAYCIQTKHETDFCLKTFGSNSFEDESQCKNSSAQLEKILDASLPNNSNLDTNDYDQLSHFGHNHSSSSLDYLAQFYYYYENEQEDTEILGFEKKSDVAEECHYFDRSDGWTGFLWFNFIIMFLLPLIVMVICYGMIIKRLSKKHSKQNTSFTQASMSFNNASMKRKISSRSERDRKRVTIMCAVLVSSFVICWLPFHAVHLAKLFGIPHVTTSVCYNLQMAVTLLAYLNSALNPYLYSFLGTNFSKRWSSVTDAIRRSVHGRTQSSSETFPSAKQQQSRKQDNTKNTKIPTTFIKKISREPPNENN